MLTETSDSARKKAQSRRPAKLERSDTPSARFVGRQRHTTVTETTTVRTRIIRERKFPKHPSSTVQLIGRDESTYPLANKELPQELRSIRWTNPDFTSGSYEVLDDSDAQVSEVALQRDTYRTINNVKEKSRSASTRYLQQPPQSPSAQLRQESTLASARRILELEVDKKEHRFPYGNPDDIKEMVSSGQTGEQRHVSSFSSSKLGLATPSTHPRAHRLARPRDQSVFYVDDAVSGLLPTPTLEHEHAVLTNAGLNTGDEDADDSSFVVLMLDPSERTRSRASRHSAVPTPPIEPTDTLLSQHQLDTEMIATRSAAIRSSRSPSEPNGTLPSPGPSVAASDADLDDEGPQENTFVDDRRYRSLSVAARPHRCEIADTTLHSAYESPITTDTESSEDEKTDVPDPMLDLSRLPFLQAYFDKLPSEMQKYAIHRLLQCCDRSVLHFVASTVNPVLKCDPMKKLPAELGLQILEYLDVQTLCRAAQVSKQWRNLVNGEDKLWKQHFEKEGFELQIGESDRALREGWGWQDPEIDGHEEDMRRLITTDLPSMDNQLAQVTQAVLRRSKRKATTELVAGKKIKRQTVSRESTVEFETADLPSSSNSPRNLKWAEQAEAAMPNPVLRIPSLRCMHFYKSLYRRHHLIKRNWMKKDPRPHHIAFRAHDNHVVTCLQFDEDKILTGSDDNSINVYETQTGRLRGQLRGHEGGVWALQYLDNQLVSGGTDRSIRVWNIERGVETHVFRGHTSTVRCLQIVMPVKTGTVNGKDVLTPRHPLIVTGSRDSSLRIWRLPKTTDEPFIQQETDGNLDDTNPYFIRKLEGHQHSVRALAAHGDILVSGSYDHTVRVWKMSTGEMRHQLTGHTAKVYSVVLDVQRSRCISGSMDYLVKVWDLQTGAALYNLEGHTSLVGLLDLNSDRLVSAAADATLRIWDPDTGACKSLLSAHTGAITCFQHDNQKVISGSERTLKMWDINTGEMQRDLLSDLSGVWQVKFNNRRCVAAVQRDSLTFIEVLDFGAARDGLPARDLGRRIEVDQHGWTPSEEPEEMEM